MKGSVCGSEHGAPRDALTNSQGAERRPQPLLIASDIAVRYRNGALGVAGVDLQVGSGEVVGLFGPNGAGKTTFVRAVSGFMRTEGARVVRGRMEFDGRNLANLDTSKIARLGVSLVPERRKIFVNMTVAENLHALAGSRADRAEAFDRVVGLFPMLKDRMKTQAGRLSGGQQQMVAIGRALLMQPRLLILDEMTLGLHASMHGPLYEAVARIADSGTSVLLVDESTTFALDVVGHCYLINSGVVTEDGPASRYRGNELLAAGYVGGTTSGEPIVVTAAEPVHTAPKRRREVQRAAPPVLIARNVSVRFGGINALEAVDVAVAPNEIVAVVGPNGAGKTTLLNAISGVVPNATAELEICGKSIANLGPARRVRAGIGRSFQDPPLIEDRSVLDNLLCGAHVAITTNAFHELLLPWRAAAADRVATDRAIALLTQVGLNHLAHTPVSALPFGPRKIIDVIRALMAEPRVVLLDEPSSGLDRGERERIARLLLDIRDVQEVSVLVVEHHLDLVREVADTVLCLHSGRTLLMGPSQEVLESPAFLNALTGIDAHEPDARKHA